MPTRASVRMRSGHSRVGRCEGVMGSPSRAERWGPDVVSVCLQSIVRYGAEDVKFNEKADFGEEKFRKARGRMFHGASGELEPQRHRGTENTVLRKEEISRKGVE